jgi:hypothetical protein
VTILRSLSRLMALAALTGSAVLLPSTSAPAAEDTCTQEKVDGIFQTFPIQYVNYLQGRPVLGEAVGNCQYRLFFDGETVTFSEEDVFLGGIVEFSDYKAQGITRKQGIQQIANTTDRVWLAPVLSDGTPGSPVEQLLSVTGYKDAIHPIFGRIVYQHRAFITQLEPGEYLSIWEGTFEGEIFTATVRLIITPSG